jgi:hypothetical protein
MIRIYTIHENELHGSLSILSIEMMMSIIFDMHKFGRKKERTSKIKNAGSIINAISAYTIHV